MRYYDDEIKENEVGRACSTHIDAVNAYENLKDIDDSEKRAYMVRY
jgi:hypothetical protein